MLGAAAPPLGRLGPPARCEAAQSPEDCQKSSSVEWEIGVRLLAGGTSSRCRTTELSHRSALGSCFAARALVLTTPRALVVARRQRCGTLRRGPAFEPGWMPHPPFIPSNVRGRDYPAPCRPEPPAKRCAPWAASISTDAPRAFSSSMPSASGLPSPS